MKRVILPNGLSIFEINPEETKFLYEEIFEGNVYSEYGIELNPGCLVIDVGANIGLYALYVLKQVEAVRMFCFEPSPICFEALRENTKSFWDQVRLFNFALGEKEGECTMSFYPNYTIMSSMFADEHEDLETLRRGARAEVQLHHGRELDDRILDVFLKKRVSDRQEIQVPIRTISQILRENQVDEVALLKVDVERAENVVLSGIEEQDWARIKQLVVEVHDQGAAEHHRMREMLEERGYQVEIHEEPTLKDTNLFILVARR